MADRNLDAGAAAFVDEILDVAHGFAFVVDVSPNGSVRMEWASAGFPRQFGYTVKDLPSYGGPLGMVHPGDRPLALSLIQSILAGGRPTGELRIVAKNGALRWARLYYSNSTYPERPGHRRLVGITQDVTGEVEARQASAANAARLRAFFEHSPIGQVTVSPEKRFLAVNPAFCALTGYGEDELVGQEVSMVVNPSVLEFAENRFRTILASGAERIDHESQWRTKDGRVIHVAVTVIPERDEDGRVRQFITAAQDITERHRAQEALERLAAVVEGSEDAIETLGLDGTVSSWNAAAERIYGYSADEIVGSTVGTIVPPEHREDLLWVLEQVAAGRSVVRHESRRIRKDGAVIDVALSFSPIRDPTGAVTGASVIARDISDAKRAQDALRAGDEQRKSLLARLIDAQQEERVRIARELHDGLGQTLTSASLFARSLEQEVGSQSHAAVRSLRTLLEEALSSTRTLVWSLRPVEVEQLGFARAVQKIADNFLARHGVPVEVHLEGVDRMEPPMEAAAFRVVQEALTNAVKHAAPTTISIFAATLDNTLRVIIEDDGDGFDAGSTLSSAAPGQGAGILGMQERAAAVGGRLVVESLPGRGTTVRLVAPCPEIDSS
jgi:two-component system sensor histidine kinase UhpB